VEAAIQTQNAHNNLVERKARVAREGKKRPKKHYPKRKSGEGKKKEKKKEAPVGHVIVKTWSTSTFIYGKSGARTRWN